MAQLQDTDNEGFTNLVRGNERYGRYCWCKMTHPVVSSWAYSTSGGGSATGCSANCGAYCANNVLTNRDALRISLFASITE